jgi:hypothetical protein
MKPTRHHAPPFLVTHTKMRPADRLRSRCLARAVRQ